jgi:hypothetical protein
MKNLLNVIWCLNIVIILTTSTLAVQQPTMYIGWHTYEPDEALFSIQLPVKPSLVEGYIIDPNDANVAHCVIDYGVSAKVYNFNIVKGAERRFLVSMLEVHIADKRPYKFITDTEVDGIDSIIGDDIKHSEVLRQEMPNGEISQWSYRRFGALGKGYEDEGMVYVRRWGTYMVIVIVDYDYAKADDVEVKMMLGSLKVRK